MCDDDLMTDDSLAGLIGNSNLINLRLRMTSSEALLVWAGGSSLSADSDFLMLEVVRGRVQV